MSLAHKIQLCDCERCVKRRAELELMEKIKAELQQARRERLREEAA